MPASTLALGASDFIQLTTFRRSGQGVPTPVWVVPDGGTLAVFTPAGTGKLKRIGHTARVTVAECNRRGRGFIPGRAVLLVSSRYLLPLHARTHAVGGTASHSRFGATGIHVTWTRGPSSN